MLHNVISPTNVSLSSYTVNYFLKLLLERPLKHANFAT